MASSSQNQDPLPYAGSSAKHKYELIPFEYNNFHASTKDFFEWWERYYSSNITDEQVLLLRLHVGFNQLAGGTTKPRGALSKAKSQTHFVASAKPTTSQIKQEPKVRKREETSAATNTPKRARTEETIVLSEDETHSYTSESRASVATSFKLDCLALTLVFLLLDTVTAIANPPAGGDGSEAVSKETDDPHKDKKERRKESKQEPSKDDGEGRASEPKEKKRKKKKHKSKSSPDQSHVQPSGTIEKDGKTSPLPIKTADVPIPVEEETSEHRVESSNSCLDPPLVKVPLSSLTHSY
ncbi:hypothetical protein TSUD_367460 [Trifolium subterraneum]|uniref:Uncharacterized protein n=1 Tax=Trifolium subterraneum TaxID=3900 RepID=A0A2Z6NDH8_TRISU|nr:hypothetical protein TSUD_367460 [Trifolium subterraneum]